MNTFCIWVLAAMQEWVLLSLSKVLKWTVASSNEQPQAENTFLFCSFSKSTVSHWQTLELTNESTKCHSRQCFFFLLNEYADCMNYS